MNISELLTVDTIKLNFSAKDKEEVIEQMLDILVKAKKISKTHKPKIQKALIARENLGSTGIGQGVGIPHAKDDCIKKITACCAIAKKGIDFDALDGEPAQIFFMLLAPKEATGEHLKTLAKISRLVRARFFRSSLIQCKTPDNLLSILKREEGELG
ncbi:MAG: PTS sugar transporter subunit IIA [Candidatus Omnitrophica bacterium]|nr:PTS sugar transporter subunit IIA [Candidatus Omnitrophota bacterium]